MGIAKALASREFCDPEFRATLYPMSDEQTTIGAILEMEPGTKDNPTWVNGEFTAVVETSASKQSKTGNPFITGKLADPDTGSSIAFSWFGRKAFPNPGTTVLIGGNGISLGEYNGTPQLTFGKSTTCNTVGNAAPQRASAPAPRSAPPPARNQAPAGQAGGFLGATVGMAINNAALDWRAHAAAQPINEQGEDEILNHEQVAKFVWQRASVYLRVAAALEAGKLSQAGAPAQAEAPPPPPPRQQPPTRPAPTSTGAAFEDGDGDDSVPF